MGIADWTLDLSPELAPMKQQRLVAASWLQHELQRLLAMAA